MFDDYKWYAVHTYSGYENKVADNILKVAENRGMRDQILEVCVPLEKTSTVSPNKSDEADANSDEATENGEKKKNVKEKERKLFPGYVLVKLAIAYDEKAEENKMSDEVWYIIRNTRGVTGFVGPDGRPVPLTQEEVIKIGVERYVVEVSYEVGDLFTIVGGSFDGFSGVVDNIDIENDTVRVIISMMGRDTPLELGLDQVESAVD